MPKYYDSEIKDYIEFVKSQLVQLKELSIMAEHDRRKKFINSNKGKSNDIIPKKLHKNMVKSKSKLDKYGYSENQAYQYSKGSFAAKNYYDKTYLINIDETYLKLKSFEKLYENNNIGAYFDDLRKDIDDQVIQLKKTFYVDRNSVTREDNISLKNLYKKTNTSNFEERIAANKKKIKRIEKDFEDLRLYLKYNTGVSDVEAKKKKLISMKKEIGEITKSNTELQERIENVLKYNRNNPRK